MNSFVLRFAALLTACVSCSHYGLRVNEDVVTTKNPVAVELSASLDTVKKNIIQHLNAMSILGEQYTKNKAHIIETKWQQSPSLRYYYLVLDEREYHPSEWKAQWVLLPAKGNKIQLTVNVFELLFWGEISEHNQNPTSDPKSNSWFETTPDLIRSQLLLKSFLEAHYSLQIPAWLNSSNKIIGTRKHLTPQFFQSRKIQRLNSPHMENSALKEVN